MIILWSRTVPLGCRLIVSPAKRSVRLHFSSLQFQRKSDQENFQGSCDRSQSLYSLIVLIRAHCWTQSRLWIPKRERESGVVKRDSSRMSGNVIKRCPATQRRQAKQQRPTVALQRHHTDLLNGIQCRVFQRIDGRMMSASNGRETATKSATSKTTDLPALESMDRLKRFRSLLAEMPFRLMAIITVNTIKR